MVLLHTQTCYMCNHGACEKQLILHILAFNVLETCQSDWLLDKVRMTSEEIKQCQDLGRLYNSREAASMLAVNIKGLRSSQHGKHPSEAVPFSTARIFLQWRCCLIGPGTKYFRISWP